MRSSNNDAWVCVGRIRGAHGIRGELAVEPLSDVAGRFAADALLFLEEPGAIPRPVRVETSRPHKNFLLLKLAGVDTRSAAEGLRGRNLLVPEALLAELPPHHHYPFRLIGCSVLERSGHALGEVADVLEGGGGALLLVKEGKREILIPLVQGIVVNLDESRRRIEVELPEGLAELDSH